MSDSMSDDAPLPKPDDAREARIAELRTRRLARMRWLATRSALVVVAVGIAVIVLGYWLLNTIGGRDVLLRQIVARLPAGSELTWSRAEGPASGPMILHDVRYVHRGCPDKDGKPVAWPACGDEALLTVFAAKRVTLDPTLRPLLGRRLQLEVLSIADATLTLPHDDSPFELPRWPESLPLIETPLAVEAHEMVVDRLRVVRALPHAVATASPAAGPEHVVSIASLRGCLEIDRGFLRMERLVAKTDRGEFGVHGEYAPRDRHRVDMIVRATLPAPAGRTRTASMELSARRIVCRRPASRRRLGLTWTSSRTASRRSFGPPATDRITPGWSCRFSTARATFRMTAALSVRLASTSWGCSSCGAASPR